MRKKITLLAAFLLVFHFWANAIKPERILVEGGGMVLLDRKVEVKSFLISKYEITNAEYAEFLNAEKISSDGIFHNYQLINVSSEDLQLEFINTQWAPKPGKENYPMVMVNYFGANEFCKWAGGKLPTEAEWLYAAKGGKKSRGYRYAGGNNLDEVGWYKENCEGHSHEVGKKKPNELGLCDMSGNAWEWCSNDSLKSNTNFCLHMGGSWFAGEQPNRLSAHYGNTPVHFSNSVGFRIVFPIVQFSGTKKLLGNYQGKAWDDRPQQIPGKIECECYDQGGEGIAYHDKDPVNNGSGKLNPADGSFLNEFRMKEGVDISYTKFRDPAIDNNPFNVVEPVKDQFYVGWTEPGEWINYTVRVNKTGMYSIGLMFTASGNGSISFEMDGRPLTGELRIPSTRNEKEPIAWRQWHHWNRIDSLTTVKLKKGIHLLKLKTVTNGNMNYDFINFVSENKSNQ